MMEQIRKETLTNEHIKQDLKGFSTQLENHKTDWFVPFFMPTTALAIILGVLTQKFWVGALVGVIPVICIIILIVQERKYSAQEKRLQNGEFYVVKEKLIRITEETIGEPHSGFGRSYMCRTAQFFYFTGSRSWRLVNGKSYAWSKVYYMSEKGIVNTSLEGDEFYLVIMKDSQTVGYIYNTKLFDYQE